MRKVTLTITLFLLATAFGLPSVWAGNLPSSEYKVLPPITSGNLAIFPVVASRTHDTSGFITLDEGLRNGSVVITEAGNVTPLVRRRGQRIPQDAEVNRLVLINNSKRPLLLLAGEVVTGGKQDRVIAMDRIVPPDSDPVDLSVFCVEPGRWVAQTEKFGSMGVQMAQPSVRRPAMAKKDQQAVWDGVRSSNAEMTVEVTAAAPTVARELAGTSSYARVMENPEVQKRVETIAAPIYQDYSKMLRQLRQQNAVGVVIAVNGRVVWADIFASGALLENYWQKLIRSYAAEAVTTRVAYGTASQHDARAFIEDLVGTREVVETEPGVFRRAEVIGDGFKVFKLTSLLGKAEFPVHIAKMTMDEARSMRNVPMR